ncbi:MAG: outer membrane protein transport protein [Elusimicrobia bacterium]|nr:outer membrane protein transport protein [Candidatus Obscuribacterium magneticum]
MKHNFIYGCGLALFVGGVCFGAGYEFEGVGARQVARGGAAIADADDWTAIYWNPGNIVKATKKSGSELGIELFGGEAYLKDSNSLSSLPGLGAIFNKDKNHYVSYLGAVGMLMPIGNKVGIGSGFYTPLLQGAKFKNTAETVPPVGLNLKNSVAILTWNVSGSYLFTPQWSAGAGLNVLYGRLTSKITVDNYLLPGNTITNKSKGDGVALEGVFGLRYDPRREVSLGAVYRTGSDLDVKGKANVDNTSDLLPDERSDFSYDLRHPPTWGIGGAYRPHQKLTVTLDYDRTLWHRFISNVHYDTPGALIVNGPNTFQWRDSWKLRLGARYGLTEKTELLGGYSYDAPAMDEGSIDLATSLDVPMNRFSAGVAHRWRENFESILSVVGGSGHREAAGVNVRLSGYQVMLETRFTF